MESSWNLSDAGKVTEGMDAVDRIAETRVNFQDRPLNPQVMKKVTVETFNEKAPQSGDF